LAAGFSLATVSRGKAKGEGESNRFFPFRLVTCHNHGHSMKAAKTSCPTPHAQRPTLHAYVVGMFLVVATLAVYWHVADNEFFNLDDYDYVLDNPNVRSGLTWDSVGWALTAFHAANWHPLTWWSLQLDCQLFGPHPAGFHRTNLFLHALNTVLLFWALRRLTGAIWPSAWVAALFALHPAHVESVAWVAERKDVLSTCFWLLTILAYLRYVERPGWYRYLAVALIFALGLMAKPMLVTLPFVLLLLDYWPLERTEWSVVSGEWYGRPTTHHSPLTTHHEPSPALIGEKIPLFLLAAGASVLTLMAQMKGNLVTPLDEIAFPDRIANALVAYVRYIGIMLWPHDLAAFYPHPRDAWRLAGGEWWVAGAALVLAAITVLCWRGRRRHPYLIMGWLWYLGTLVPVIGLVQVGTQAMADRYTYVPFIGLFIIVVWGLNDLWARCGFPQAALAGLAGLTLVFLMLPTWLQVVYWSDSITQWRHTLDVTVDNYVAHLNLGMAYRSEGKRREALHHAAEASLSREEALRQFMLALRLRPDLPVTHNGVGVALYDQGKMAEALAQFNAALQIAPRDAATHIYLGWAYLKLGDVDRATTCFETALAIKPDLADAHLGLGQTNRR
jgi:hypothetical protein